MVFHNSGSMELHALCTCNLCCVCFLEMLAHVLNWGGGGGGGGVRFTGSLFCKGT